MAEYIEPTCGDCIHADICKDVVGSWFSRKNIAYCKTFMRAADVVPVVHGRWEFDGSDWSDIWKCSACGDEWFFEYDPRDEETLVKYCPNCGAHMKEADGNG